MPMRPSAILRALRVLFSLPTPRPAFLHGPPGVGKSDLIRQAAAAAGAELIDVRAVLLDPVDLRGLPMVDRQEGKPPVATWAPPGFLPTRPGPGVLFLDELPAAPIMTQCACLQLTLDRALGEYRLPDGWHVIAAGNRSTDRAGAGKLSTALASRFVHLDLEVSHDDFMTWARAAALHPTVIAFLNFRPGALHDFDPASNPEGFPCPRTWAFASDLYAGLVAADDLALELDVIGGTVGMGAAAEFVAFSRIARNLPDVADVLRAPGSATVPSAPPVLYALAAALGYRARELPEPALDNLVAYVDRMPAEFAVLTMRDALASRPDLLRRPAAAKWVQKNLALLGVS